jgi:hypothetical protein
MRLELTNFLFTLILKIQAFSTCKNAIDQFMWHEISFESYFWHINQKIFNTSIRV